MIIAAICESSEIAESMTGFIQFRSFGIVFACVHVTTAAMFIGLGKTNIYMMSAIIMAVANIILDYGLIFGELGLPQMGVRGAALASSISEFLACLFLLCYALFSPRFKEFKCSLRHKINGSEILRLAKLSYPLMLQGILALATWLVFFMMIEQLGPEKLEASHNIRYMYFIAFVPIFGFGATTRTFVSNLVGQGKRELIAKTQWRIALLSLATMFAVFHGSIFYPELMIEMINHNPNISPGVMADSISILQFVCGSIFLFSLIVVPYSTVSGLGKTKAALLIEVSAIVTYLIASYVFIVLWKWDIVMVWSVEYIYFATMGILSLVLLRYFKNRPV
jgi:Na+-driven multidrug efflux pump